MTNTEYLRLLAYWVGRLEIAAHEGGAHRAKINQSIHVIKGSFAWPGKDGPASFDDISGRLGPGEHGTPFTTSKATTLAAELDFLNADARERLGVVRRLRAISGWLEARFGSEGDNNTDRPVWQRVGMAEIDVMGTVDPAAELDAELAFLVLNPEEEERVLSRDVRFVLDGLHTRDVQ